MPGSSRGIKSRCFVFDFGSLITLSSDALESPYSTVGWALRSVVHVTDVVPSGRGTAWTSLMVGFVDAGGSFAAEDIASVTVAAVRPFASDDPMRAALHSPVAVPLSVVAASDDSVFAAGAVP